MNFKLTSGPTLLAEIKNLAIRERKITLDVLWYLKEIELRKEYFSLGYRSSFEYCIKELSYSEAAAMRRIQAMRALKENPQIASQIESGSLSVTSVARIHSFVRKNEKQSHQKWSTEEKAQLYSEIEGKSHNQIEKTLVKISPEASVFESVKPIRPNLNEIKLYLNDEELSELNELRGWLAHQLDLPSSNSELIKKLIRTSREAIIKEKAETSPAKPITQGFSAAEVKWENPVSLKSPPNLNPKNSRYIPLAVKRVLFARSNLRCEHVNPQTQKRCSSNFKLEIHHVHPFAKGGSNQLANLEIVCRAHNVSEAWKENLFKVRRTG